MWYDLKNPLEVKSLSLRLERLAASGAMVEVVEKKPRSLKANAYLHAILSYMALQTGNTPEDVKNCYYKRVCNEDIFLRTKEDPILGGEREYLRSTASLTSEEMAVSIDRFRNWCSSVAGIYIPSSDEHIALIHMQHDIEQAKRWL